MLEQAPLRRKFNKGIKFIFIDKFILKNFINK